MRLKPFAIASTAALMLSGLAACGGSESGSGADDPIKVGFSTYLTGINATTGEAYSSAAKAWVKMTNDDGGILGRKVELEIKDDAGEQTKAIQNLRTFASEGINLVIPNGTSSICAALGPIADQLNIIMSGGCADPSLLPPDGPDSYYMAALSQDAYAKAAGTLAKEKFSAIKTWDIYTMDYLTGHTLADKVEGKFEEAGATVGSKVFVPLTASDQRAYINALDAKATGDNRGLYIYAFGSIGPNFVKQASALGLFEKYDQIVFQQLNDAVMDTAGQDLPPMWGIIDWNPLAYGDVAETQKFLKVYEAEYPDVPLSWQFSVAVQALEAFKGAIEKADSTKYQDMKSAMDKGFPFRGVKGDVTLNNHYMVASMALFHCAGDAAVKQGWSCDESTTLPAEDITPEEFLP